MEADIRTRATDSRRPKINTDISRDTSSGGRRTVPSSAVSRSLHATPQELPIVDSWLDLGADDDASIAAAVAAGMADSDDEDSDHDENKIDRDDYHCHLHKMHNGTIIIPRRRNPGDILGDFRPIAAPSTLHNHQLPAASSSLPPHPFVPPPLIPTRIPAAMNRLSDDSTSPDDIFTARLRRDVSSEDSSMISFEAQTPSSASTDFNIALRDNNPNDDESIPFPFLKSGDPCRITPQSGPFRGQLIAFISQQQTPSPTATEVSLPPESDDEACREQVQIHREAAQDWPAEVPRPHVWIVLLAVPKDNDGFVDIATLLEWAHGLDEEAEQRIMTWQFRDHQRIRKESIEKLQPEPLNLPPRPKSSWPEELASVWRDDEVDHDSRSENSSFDDDIGASEFFPLSAMQQLYFRTSISGRIEANAVNRRDFRFTQSILLEVRGLGIALAEVEAAIEALAARHSMLRARFRLTRRGWAQFIAPQARTSYSFGHCCAENDGEILAAMEQAEAAINVMHGPVFSVQHIRARDGRQLLYLVGHHLVVDLVSWRIILHDLSELLETGTLLSEGSMPFPHWIDYQNHKTSGKNLPDLALPFNVTPANRDYWDLAQYPNCYGDADHLTFLLNPDVTDMMQKTCASVLRADSGDMILAALLQSFCLTFPDRAAPTIWKQEEGRAFPDSVYNIQETVGWFTSLCPMNVDADANSDFIHLLKVVKDTRKAIPHHGIPFFATEFSASANPATNVPVELMFNCVDNLQRIHRKGGVLEPATAPGREVSSLISDVGPSVGRIALFEVSVVLDDSGSRVEALYNKHSRHHDRICSWMQRFEHVILEGIGRLRVMEPELTLSDAPLLKASYSGMAKLTTERLARLGLDSVNDIETLYPVNPAQQEILVAQGQDLDCYHVHSIYELTPSDGSLLDQARLCSAWEKLVASHPSLRSVFIDSISDNSLFDQVILNKISPAMLFIDDVNPEETLASLPSLRTLPAQPRHRLSVCTTANRTFVRLDASQAICDPISIHNLIHELRQAYSGEMPPIDRSAIPAFLRHTSTRDKSKGLSVWKANLAHAKPCMFPRLTLQPQEHLQSRSYEIEITREEIDNYCRSRQIEPSILVRLAWALVLRAFTSIDRVSFGYQLTGRVGDKSSSMGRGVGSFANILPCYVDLSQQTTITQALHGLVEHSATAMQHQFLTIPEIHHALGLRIDEIFNTCLSFHDSALDDENMELPTAFEPSLVTSARTSDCELSLSVMFKSDHLHVNVSFRHLSFTQAHNTINTFEQALRTIIAASENDAVCSLDLFTERDYAQLLMCDWDSTQKGEKLTARLNKQILRHVMTQPDAPAIVAWEGSVTYRQMESFVARLATYLVSHGVKPGVTVPLVLAKSKWSPIAMLAVLEAGGCFISLDPQDRPVIESTIKYLNSQIVVSTEDSWTDPSVKVINPALLNEIFFSAKPSSLNTVFASESTPDHAACVFFTPGKMKTNAPRSIFFTHTSLCSAFAAQGPVLRIDHTSRVFQLSAFSVDIALVEILGTLFHGGCVCIPHANERIQDVGGSIARMQVTWSYMTSVLARRIDPVTVPTLKTLCFRTRSLDEDTYGPWLGSRTVLMAYGAPDVCPLGISVAEVGTSKISNIIPPPLLGRFWVLNPNDSKKLMPVGATGELGIDSPVITPQKFYPGIPPVVSTPIKGTTGQPKGRYLKTGHRVRYLENGNLQFLSSMRDEIEVGGSPVVVTNVEQCIRRCIGRGIDVAVDLVTTSDSIPTLVAFLELGEQLFQDPNSFEEISLVMKETAFLSKKRVEAALAGIQERNKRVPMHHIPPAFVPLKHFPISTSLKVNKRKLQKMISGLTYAQLMDLSTVPNPTTLLHPEKPLPMTQGEELMRRIWAGVIGLAPLQISGTSSFFGVGGDKYLAAKLVIACRQAGYKVSLRDVLQGATLTEICQAVAASDTTFAKPRSAGEFKPTIPATRVAGFDDRFIKEVVGPQLKVHWQDVLDVAEASAHQIRSLETGMYKPKGDLHSLILNFNGPIRHQRLEVACEALTRLHPILRTAFAIHDRRVYQVLLESFKAAFERRTCQQWQLSSLSDEVVQQTRNSEFSLSEPVTRFTFLDAGQQGVLIIRVSSAQVDEMSVALLVQDLITLYDDANGVLRKSNFLDYMRAAQTANYKEGMDYWNEQLQAAKMTQIVSTTKPAGPTHDVRTIHESIKINHLNGVTFDTVLKAAWSNVLATLSGTSDVLFGELVHAYSITLPDHVDVTSLVGPLANIIPVRVGFPPKHSTPFELMQFLHNQRASGRPFEAAGFLELVQNCTNWSYWTRFSTIVHHKSQVPVDGSTTLNMGNTTFTYQFVEPLAKDIPDLFVCSKLDGPGKVDLEISYSEGRIPSAFVENTMQLLIGAVEMFTGYDSINQPLLPSATDIEQLNPQVPLVGPEVDEDKPPLADLLTNEQRNIIQAVINSAWTDILNPIPLGVPQAQIHRANFYDLWGSLLPAYFFAENFNRELPRLKILGLERVRITIEEIVEHPNMASQCELFAKKMREAGSFPTPSSRRKTATGSGIWAPSATIASPLTWRRSLRKLRSQDSRASMRDLGSKAGDWMRGRVNMNRDGASTPIHSPIYEESLSGSDEQIRLHSKRSNDSSISQLPPQLPTLEMMEPVEIGSSESNNGIAELSPLSAKSPVAGGSKVGAERLNQSAMSPLRTRNFI
ncbi:Nonribosomal peptide synthetase fmqA [Paramyrothecium foliicola]|nr:Nonribosomal peptide synthetase fmqA [Paramyrothecium foliicola]